MLIDRYVYPEAPRSSYRRRYLWPVLRLIAKSWHSSVMVYFPLCAKCMNRNFWSIRGKRRGSALVFKYFYVSCKASRGFDGSPVWVGISRGGRIAVWKYVCDRWQSIRAGAGIIRILPVWWHDNQIESERTNGDYADSFIQENPDVAVFQGIMPS